MPRKDESADRIRILHMRDAAREAVGFVVNRTRADLDTDRMLARALTHCVQEIGEAASRVTDGARAPVPALPWRKIVGMRHIRVHDYDRIDADAVWRVVQEDLPELIAAADEALKSWPGLFPPPAAA